MKENATSLVSHTFKATELRQYLCWVGFGWTDSLLSLAFATRWSSKFPSYVSICFFCNSISQL